ncbi:type II toxin-antitoxin system RelE/ParE family toxin [Pseudomonas fluorescens]|uniref:type II toxin-antitoxin system RelE/ParE family toxin n=1 Tax=Pseudomonas fluorescens TaxID=294 RepID=UPI003526ABEF
MRIEWRPEARADLKQLINYIADRNLPAAIELNQAIHAAASTVSKHPHLYRTGRVRGTREIVAHANYLLVYRVTDQIEILNVLHARQEYP